MMTVTQHVKTAVSFHLWCWWSSFSLGKPNDDEMLTGVVVSQSSVFWGCVFLLMGRLQSVWNEPDIIADRSWWNSLNAKERCFTASYLITFSRGCAGPLIMKGGKRELILLDVLNFQHRVKPKGTLSTWCAAVVKWLKGSSRRALSSPSSEHKVCHSRPTTSTLSLIVLAPLLSFPKSLTINSSSRLSITPLRFLTKVRKRV